MLSYKIKIGLAPMRRNTTDRPPKTFLTWSSAKALGKPVCLWAPLDDEYYVHGMRPTDSQCGLFGFQRQLRNG